MTAPTRTRNLKILGKIKGLSRYFVSEILYQHLSHFRRYAIKTEHKSGVSISKDEIILENHTRFLSYTLSVVEKVMNTSSLRPYLNVTTTVTTPHYISLKTRRGPKLH